MTDCERTNNYLKGSWRALIAPAVLFLSLSAAASLHAQTASHGFETLYPGLGLPPAAATLNGQAGGSGWGAPWSIPTAGDTAVEVVNTSVGSTIPKLFVSFVGPSTNLSGSTRAIRFNPLNGQINRLVERPLGTNFNGSDIWVSMLFRLPAGFTLENGNVNGYTGRREFFAFSIGNDTAAPDDLTTSPSIGMRDHRFFARSLESATTTVFFDHPSLVPGSTLSADQTFFLVAYFEWVWANPLNTAPGDPGNYKTAGLWVRTSGDSFPGLSVDGQGNPEFNCAPPFDAVGAAGTSRLFGTSGGGVPVNVARFRSLRNNSASFANDFIFVDNIIIGDSCADVVVVPDPENPLRVDLLSFTASSTGPGAPVLLEWETAAEVDNAGFNIYRSNNGVPGERLNPFPIPAQGAENVGSVYSFLDTTPLGVGEVRGYFLEDVELNGKATLHGPVSTSASGVGESRVEQWSLYD